MKKLIAIVIIGMTVFVGGVSHAQSTPIPNPDVPIVPFPQTGQIVRPPAGPVITTTTKPVIQKPTSLIRGGGASRRILLWWKMLMNK